MWLIFFSFLIFSNNFNTAEANWEDFVHWLETFFNPQLSHAPKFHGNFFFNVDIGLSDIDGFVGAFGDFNSDRYTDLFIVSADRKNVTVFLWNRTDWKFFNYFTIDSNLTSITSIAATDIDHDGTLDLLVQGTSNGSSDNYIQWYRGNYQNLTFAEELPTSVGQIIIMDANADMIPDFLGQRKVNNTLHKYYWMNSPPGNITLQLAQDLQPNVSLSLNHSNAFVDINGDCIADLVLKEDNNGETTYSFYLNQKGSFNRSKLDTHIPQGAGQLTFSDIDGDGAIDVLFPVCWPANDCSQENSIHIIYNIQKRVCRNFFDTECISETSLCQGDINWHYDPFNSKSGENVVIVKLDIVKGSRLYAPQDFPNLKIRTGDYNLDTFPDILVPIITSDNHVKLQIWVSTQCSVNLGCDESANYRRTFYPLNEVIANDLNTLDGAFSGAFFDFDEDGTADMIVSTITDHGISVHGIFNNINNDAFFFKTLALNGLCTQWCTSTGKVMPNPRPYGVNQYGATMKFTIMDLNGIVHAYSVAQLSQTADLPLLTPYTLNGLARPSNYIQYFFLGIPIKSQEQHYYYWSGLIPNSQIVVIPYPPNSPDSWRPELYLNPSEITLWILVAVVGWLLVTGVAIIYFTWSEKKQDEKELKEREHLFSFKAM